MEYEHCGQGKAINAKTLEFSHNRYKNQDFIGTLKSHAKDVSEYERNALDTHSK